jgi:hypothetical protein
VQNIKLAVGEFFAAHPFSLRRGPCCCIVLFSLFLCVCFFPLWCPACHVVLPVLSFLFFLRLASACRPPPPAPLFFCCVCFMLTGLVPVIRTLSSLDAITFSILINDRAPAVFKKKRHSCCSVSISSRSLPVTRALRGRSSSVLTVSLPHFSFP